MATTVCTGGAVGVDSIWTDVAPSGSISMSIASLGGCDPFGSEAGVGVACANGCETGVGVEVENEEGGGGEGKGVDFD